MINFILTLLLHHRPSDVRQWGREYAEIVSFREQILVHAVRPPGAGRRCGERLGGLFRFF
jgi:hypothetical protein